jgi:hypothetical protein
MSEEIASFFGRKTPRRKKYLLIRHVLDCRPCRDEFEWRHELELRIAGLSENVGRLKQKCSSRGGLPKSASRTKPSMLRWAWAGIGSAGLLIVLLLFMPARRFLPDHKPTYREAPQFQFQDVYPPVGATVNRADLHFSWKAPLPGGSFIIELFDPTMRLLWRDSMIRETETRIPERILRLMKEEQVYFWSISGIGDDQLMIESPLFSFRFAR